MTPFMIRVAELVGADADPEELPVVATRPVAATPVNVGADKYIAIRSLAEQLVCEANAVIQDADDHLRLDDEFGGEDLAFDVRFRGRAARVSMRLTDGKAYGQLAGDGIPGDQPRELAGTDAVADLLLLLISESGMVHHPG